MKAGLLELIEWLECYQNGNEQSPILSGSVKSKAIELLDRDKSEIMDIRGSVIKIAAQIITSLFDDIEDLDLPKSLGRTRYRNLKHKIDRHNDYLKQLAIKLKDSVTLKKNSYESNSISQGCKKLGFK